MYVTGCKMMFLRTLLVLVVFLASSVSCDHKQDPICTEGGKICSFAEAAEISQPENATTDLETARIGQSAADSTGSALAPAEGSVGVKATDDTIDAGVEDNDAKQAVLDDRLSNQTATNTSSPASSDIAAQSSTSAEETSPLGVEGHPSDHDNADANRSVQVNSEETAEVNVSKLENSSVSAVTNNTKQDSSVNDEANVSAQNGSVEVSGANASKQETSVGVVESNTTKQENSVSTAANATKDENSPDVDESNTSKNVSVEAATNNGNTSVIDSEGNASRGISANSSVPSLDILPNATTVIHTPEHNIAKNQTSENATEGLNRTEAVSTAEGQETADSSETRAQTNNNTSSPSKEAVTDVSSPELVAVAEGIVLASAVLQVATAKPPPAAYLDPAQEVALAEGLEMADAVLQAVKEDEPVVNAIWRATLEAESRMKQDDTPVNEQTLDKGLMAFLVCVMIVLAVTGSVSGWVLYTRLRRTPEEDQAQNMYILIDAADPQSNFVDCPLELNDSAEVSYTFPHDTPTFARDK